MSKFSPLNWPVVRQLRAADAFARDVNTQTGKSRELEGRIDSADRMVKSVCPYCAVGCSQRVYVKDERVIQVEGDPDSPISRGRLCPKGSASEQLINSATRLTKIKYRAPYATEWTELDTDTAMEMITDRFLASRKAKWQEVDESGRPLRRTMGVAGLGGATLDNEENYLIKKLFTATGAIQVENQARI
ncbi:dehydrogenase [Corynebacterium phocae]|nr:dehydrogenase [Corynebacterium phocae]KAA8723153.1 dehydrogenase [Corynebacterium phocae]